jgi:hypothetical protein
VDHPAAEVVVPVDLAAEVPEDQVVEVQVALAADRYLESPLDQMALAILVFQTQDVENKIS